MVPHKTPSTTRNGPSDFTMTTEDLEGVDYRLDAWLWGINYNVTSNIKTTGTCMWQYYCDPSAGMDYIHM